MKILSIECSDAPVSCALVEDGKIICEHYMDVGLTHSQTLMPMVDDVLCAAKVNISDIDLFAVTNGPGSFTGIRIGIAAIKGMAYGVDKPCVGVSTLHAIAYGVSNQKGIVCASMDARCNQVYNALFYSEGETLQRLCEDRALMIDELGDILCSLKQEEIYKNCDIIFAGHGSELCYNILNGKVPDIRLAPIHDRYQRASFAAIIADEYDKVGAGELMPCYLRLPQAERELKAKRKEENKDE